MLYRVCNSLLLVLGLSTSAQQLSSMAFSQESSKSDRPPNFVVILCDNLGYGDIEPFGANAIRTPALNRMAQEGRLFSHFYVSAGVCTPSRASLMTGCYAQRVGMHLNPRDGQVLRPLSPYGLSPNEQTIAEVLRDQGYATGLIGKWHLGDQPDFLPTRQGFDYFLGVPYSDDMTQAVGQRLAARSQNDALDGRNWPPLPLMNGEQVIEAPVDRNGLTARYTLAAQEFIETHREEPFFLLLSHAMPGSTTQPFSSPRFRGKSALGPWGDSVEELDWSTGEILQSLRDLQLDQNTLVVWTSDNGAPMSSGPNQPFRGTNAPLKGRGYTTSEGGFRVPTIFWWPGRVPAHSVCESLASTMDLLPTFAKLAGAADLPKVDGFDIRSLMYSDQAQSPYTAFYYYERDQLQAVRAGPWKLFLPLEEFSRHPHFQRGVSSQPLLFDLIEDVSCARNVAAMHPDVVDRLMILAEKARSDLGDRGKAGIGQRVPGKIEGKPIAQRLP